MREHLLGYLVDALEPHEKKTLETSLSQDEQLRRELDTLRMCLQPLAADAGHFDPPSGLASRTCSFVASRILVPASRQAPPAVGGWRAADLIVAACVLVAGTLVFFPALSYSRFQSQVAGCQNNLREVGLGFSQLVQYNAGFYPQLPTTGKDATAGLHAALLREGGYVTRNDAFLCPGVPTSESTANFPKRADLRAAVGDQLRAMRRAIGGAYGYPLGYIDNGRYQAMRNQGRGTFAIVADAPNVSLTAVSIPTVQSANHGGFGQNVLFEDGRVKFLENCQTCPHSKDDFYHNDDGEIAAGKHANDSVIGASHISPLGVDLVE